MQNEVEQVRVSWLFIVGGLPVPLVNTRWWGGACDLMHNSYTEAADTKWKFESSSKAEVSVICQDVNWRREFSLARYNLSNLA